MSMYGIYEKVPEYYIVSLINSSFISEYVDDFINNTQTFQINDARQLPIIIPTDEQLQNFHNIFINAVDIKQKFFRQELNGIAAEQLLSKLQEKQDYMVKKLYLI